MNTTHFPSPLVAFLCVAMALLFAVTQPGLVLVFAFLIPIRWYPLLRGNVAEHSILLVILAAHSLVSFVFLHSDEFS